VEQFLVLKKCFYKAFFLVEDLEANLFLLFWARHLCQIAGFDDKLFHVEQFINSGSPNSFSRKAFWNLLEARLKNIWLV